MTESRSLLTEADWRVRAILEREAGARGFKLLSAVDLGHDVVVVLFELDGRTSLIHGQVETEIRTAVWIDGKPRLGAVVKTEWSDA